VPTSAFAVGSVFGASERASGVETGSDRKHHCRWLAPTYLRPLSLSEPAALCLESVIASAALRVRLDLKPPGEHTYFRSNPY
jgi:hypothetical protein